MPGHGSVGWAFDPAADCLTMGELKRARAAEDRRRRMDGAFARLRATRRPPVSLAEKLGPAIAPAARLRGRT
jgi:hypothetical protein